MPKPPSSRMQLPWHYLNLTEDGNWCLNLPPYYAHLFEEQEPDIMAKSNTGWRDSTSGKKARFAFFVGLIKEEVDRIKRFVTDYERLLILGINKHIKDIANDELTACIALDFNFNGPDGDHTAIGALEYSAKYEQSMEAATQLIDHLRLAVHRIPGIKGSLPPRYVSYVPSSSHKSETFCLPRLLAEGLISTLDKSFFNTDNPLVHTRYKVSKPKVKGLSLQQKKQEWSRLIQDNLMVLSGSVKNATVIVVDDLYQSGTTIWHIAKYLKESEGAAQVFGLVCVKTLRDTDNK